MVYWASCNRLVYRHSSLHLCVFGDDWNFQSNLQNYKAKFSMEPSFQGAKLNQKSYFYWIVKCDLLNYKRVSTKALIPGLSSFERNKRLTNYENLKVEKLTENCHYQTSSRNSNQVASSFLCLDHFRLLQLKSGLWKVRTMTSLIMTHNVDLDRT